MIKFAYKNGFTLIELLVVIAIIGLLAAIILVSVGSARNKGIDAAVKGHVRQIRAYAELYASSNANSYLGLCISSGSITLLNGAANSASIGTTSVQTASTSVGVLGTKVTCHDTNTMWAVEAPLSGGSTNWCADSTGNTGREIAFAIVANGTNCATPLQNN